MFANKSIVLDLTTNLSILLKMWLWILEVTIGFIFDIDFGIGSFKESATSTIGESDLEITSGLLFAACLIFYF